MSRKKPEFVKDCHFCNNPFASICTTSTSFEVVVDQEPIQADLMIWKGAKLVPVCIICFTKILSGYIAKLKKEVAP